MTDDERRRAGSLINKFCVDRSYSLMKDKDSFQIAGRYRIFNDGICWRCFSLDGSFRGVDTLLYDLNSEVLIDRMMIPVELLRRLDLKEPMTVEQAINFLEDPVPDLFVTSELDETTQLRLEGGILMRGNVKVFTA